MQVPSTRNGARLAALVGALALGACDIPTSLPQIESTWRIPGDTTTLSVASLLPSEVAISSDGSAFVLTLEATQISRSLAELCSSCAAAHGFTVPKPAFSFDIQDQVELPPEVASATVSGGNLVVSLTHDFGFDPIRPSATARGSYTITLRSGGRVLATQTQNGTTVDLASGNVRTLILPVAPGPLSGPLDVELTMTSPAGDPVTINANSTFRITVSTADLLLSEANVAVENQQVSVEQVELDLEDIDAEISDKVKSGQLRLTIVNPFAVQGNLSLSVLGASMPIAPKTIAVAPSTTTQVNIDFTGPELQAMLGRTVRLDVSGPFSATGGTITVRPDQVVVLRSTLQLVLGPTEG